MKRLLLLLVLAVPLLAQPRQSDCREWWGKDAPCPADGKYYDHTGKEQPATCNNNFQTDETHKCHCAKDTTELKDCPSNNMRMDMSKCSVYCREDACKCVSVCDNNDGT